MTTTVDDALVGSFRALGYVGEGGHYLPMMHERTPVSLALLERFAATAAAPVGRKVLPLRAKCVLCSGNASWYADSEVELSTRSRPTPVT